MASIRALVMPAGRGGCPRPHAGAALNWAAGRESASPAAAPAASVDKSLSAETPEHVWHVCAPRQQGAQRDTRLGKCCQAPGTAGGAGGGAGGGGASFRALSPQGGALAGAGADLWGLARDSVDTAEVVAEGRGWPQLYPQAWPRPILGAHLAHLFISGHPRVEMQLGCTWSDGAELPSAPHSARANVTVEKTDVDGPWGTACSSRPEAAVSRGCPSRLRGRSQAGRRQTGWAGPGTDTRSGKLTQEEFGLEGKVPGGASQWHSCAPRTEPRPHCCSGEAWALGLSPNHWTGENRERSPTAVEPEQSARDPPGTAARSPGSASDRSRETLRTPLLWGSCKVMRFLEKTGDMFNLKPSRKPTKSIKQKQRNRNQEHAEGLPWWRSG